MTKKVFTVHADGTRTQDEEDQLSSKVHIGKVPIMLRSAYCALANHTNKELQRLGECPYDQGGYFVINGSEKVLIAQEKMSTNHVYVFKKKQPSKYSYVAEVPCQPLTCVCVCPSAARARLLTAACCLQVRSLPEQGARAASACMVRLLERTSGRLNQKTLRVTLPYIRQDIPIVIIFRALGAMS